MALLARHVGRRPDLDADDEATDAHPGLVEMPGLTASRDILALLQAGRSGL
jgi:hypothetical protein